MKTSSRKKSSEKSSSYSFVGYLEKRLRESPPNQKGARTREHILIATAKMLGANGYHAMRVSDITSTAGVADGSFYVYFKDKKDASLRALSAFLTEFVDLFAPLEAVDTSFESIQAANRRWFAICRANAGLLRCVFQLGDQEADFGRLSQRITHKWYSRIQARFERDEWDAHALLLAIYLMGSMMDELVRKLIVFPDREFQKLLRSCGADDDAVADAASLLWIRIFDPTAEPPRGLAPVVSRLAEVMWAESNPDRKGTPGVSAARSRVK